MDGRAHGTGVTRRWHGLAAAVVLQAAAGAGAVAAPAGDALQRALVNLQADPRPTVFAGHPRLIVGGYRGVPVAELRAACARPELRGQCDALGGRHVLDDAMRYLVAGDRAAADRVAAQLRGLTACRDGDVGSEHSPWGGLALAFDWVWDALPDVERRRLDALWPSCAAALARQLDGNGPHLWHGYTSLAASEALVALAIDDPAGRAAALPKAVEHFRQRALEAYAVVGGAWPEGYNYLRSHFFSADPPSQYVMDALRAWDSAIERDTTEHASLFGTIAADEGDWLRGLGHHILYGTLDGYGPGGKRTLLRGGDMPTGQAWPNKQVRPFVDSIARVTGDGHLAKWGRDLEADWPFVGGDGTYHPIHRYSLPYNLPLDVPSRAPDEPSGAAGDEAAGGALPLGRIWGRTDLGYVLARSAWGPGETTLGYRAGAWFTGHQHMDQGHLDLWRKGPLAVDAGVYANWGSMHREAYYARTVAHNTLLIPRPGERFDQHPALGGTNVNDGGQRIHTFARGGCPQCMQSVAEWRAHVGAGLHFEAGRIDAFADAPGHTVVASDLTAAYNSADYSTPGNAAKVAVVHRDVVFLRPDLVVVTDRVRTMGGTGAPRFTLHLPGRPDLDGAVVDAGSADDGRVHTDTPRFTFDNGTGGRLAFAALAPADARLTAIGGPGHRYWVDGANRDGGAAGHEGAPAEPGAWRIESAPRDDAPTPPDAGPRDHVLVHALTVTDTGRTAWPATLVAATGDRAGPGPAHAIVVRAPTRTRVLVQSAAVLGDRIQFATVALGPGAFGGAEVLAMHLVPNADYTVSGASPQFTLRRVRTDAEGVLHVGGAGDALVNSGGTVHVARCPAPIDAGAVWRLACGGSDVPATPATATAGPTAAATSTPAHATPPPAGGRVWLPWGGRR